MAAYVMGTPFSPSTENVDTGSKTGSNAGDREQAAYLEGELDRSLCRLGRPWLRDACPEHDESAKNNHSRNAECNVARDADRNHYPLVERFRI
jgi:hypothetical protein